MSKVDASPTLQVESIGSIVDDTVTGTTCDACVITLKLQPISHSSVCLSVLLFGTPLATVQQANG